MKVFKENGKYGVKNGFRIIVEPKYISKSEMVENDPFFNKKQANQEENKTPCEKEKE